MTSLPDGTPVVCTFCGKPFSEHIESRPDGAPVPRMPCVGLRRHFIARIAKPVPETAPAYTIDECIGVLELDNQIALVPRLGMTILHHLRAAQANGSREAEIRAEAWDEGYRMGRFDERADAEFLSGPRAFAAPKLAANPYRSGT